MTAGFRPEQPKGWCLPLRRRRLARVAPNGHWEIGFGDTAFQDVCSTSPRQEATGTQSGEGWTWGPPHTQRVRAVVAGGVPLQTECRWRKNCPKRSRGPSFAGLGDKESEAGTKVREPDDPDAGRRRRFKGEPAMRVPGDSFRATGLRTKNQPLGSET